MLSTILTLHQLHVRRPLAALAAALAVTVGLALVLAQPATAHAARAARPPAPPAQHLAVPAAVRMPVLESTGYTTRIVDLPLVLRAATARTAVVVAYDVADVTGVSGHRPAVIAAALSFLGTPYVFGGASRSGIDCSGLVMRAYQRVGVRLPHLVSGEDGRGRRIAAAAARPGDLVVYNDEDHVGIYLGDRLVVAAPRAGQRVQVQPLRGWTGVGVHFTRLLAR